MKKTHIIIPNRNTRLLTISMSEDAKKEFDSFCNENTVNKSKLVAWLIQQHLGNIKSDQEARQK